MNAPEILRDRHSKTLLVYKEGRTLLHALTIAPPVSIVTLPKHTRRDLLPLEYRGRPYPLPRALRRFRQAGRELGITKGARRILRVLDARRRQAAP